MDWTSLFENTGEEEDLVPWEHYGPTTRAARGADAWLPATPGGSSKKKGRVTYSRFALFCITLNYILGVGTLGIPYAFSKAGIVLSVLMFLLVSIISAVTVVWVAEAGVRANRMLDLGIKSYAALNAQGRSNAKESGGASGQAPANTHSINEHDDGPSATRLSIPGSLSSASSFESLADLEEAGTTSAAGEDAAGVDAAGVDIRGSECGSGGGGGGGSGAEHGMGGTTPDGHHHHFAGGGHADHFLGSPGEEEGAMEAEWDEEPCDPPPSSTLTMSSPSRQSQSPPFPLLPHSLPPRSPPRSPTSGQPRRKRTGRRLLEVSELTSIFIGRRGHLMYTVSLCALMYIGLWA